MKKARRALLGRSMKPVRIACINYAEDMMSDRMMARLGQAYPAYGFASNAGYSTKAHLTVIASEGPCPFHRLSFSPLRQGLLDL